MADVQSHYRELLAPIYLWMAGGSEAALAAGAADLADLPPVSAAGALALDLGAGFGMHAIPLARAGYEVIALDTSHALLEQLKELGEGLPIRAAVADLMRFPEHLPLGRQADLILCMGDTLTHLPDRALVDALAVLVARSLAPAGTFMATFRDYTTLPADSARFIPVRSDDSRILTCFLEDRCVGRGARPPAPAYGSGMDTAGEPIQQTQAGPGGGGAGLQALRSCRQPRRGPEAQGPADGLTVMPLVDASARRRVRGLAAPGARWN